MKRKLKPSTTLIELFERPGFPGKKYRRPVVRAFRAGFKDFTAYLGHDATVADLTDATMIAWIAANAQDARGFSARTLQSRVSHVIQFWRWLALSGYVENFPEAVTTEGRLRKIGGEARPKPPSSRAPVRQFPPEMSLRELIEKHYIPHATLRSKRAQLSKYMIGQFETFHSYMALFLRREPRVSDLAIPVNDFLSWLKIGFPNRKSSGHRIIFEAICRFVGLLPYKRPEVGQDLSDAPDTLWGICLKRYFPTRPNLKSHDTRRQYQIAIADFRDFLGREPKVEDLTTVNVLGMMKALDDRGLSPSTTNERRGRLVSLWNWLARKRETAEFPTIEKLQVPRRLPRAWTREEIERIFLACAEEKGEIVPGVAAADFWLGLHAVIWDCGERIGAVLGCTWDMLDEKNGLLEIPAELRKGRAADMLHALKPATVAILLRMKPAGFERIFHWPLNKASFYRRYAEILTRAGLPAGRKDKFHRMRKSYASHLQAGGVDACAALGHSGPEVTRKSYLDPRIILGDAPPCAVLFTPNPEMPRLEYSPKDESETVVAEAWL